MFCWSNICNNFDDYIKIVTETLFLGNKIYWFILKIKFYLYSYQLYDIGRLIPTMESSRDD